MSVQLSAVKVLLADDNPHLRAIVGAVLAGIGIHKVYQCSDGAQALDFLKRWQADIAIVDFQMDPVDGVEFTHLVRNSTDSVNPNLPIIMLTGHADRARVCEARDAGVTEFIVKPVTARALFDRINAVIYRPRPFIRSESYYGPDRRRHQDPYVGPDRRAKDQAQKAAS